MKPRKKRIAAQLKEGKAVKEMDAFLEKLKKEAVREMKKRAKPKKPKKKPKKLPDKK